MFSQKTRIPQRVGHITAEILPTRGLLHSPQCRTLRTGFACWAVQPGSGGKESGFVVTALVADAAPLIVA